MNLKIWGVIAIVGIFIFIIIIKFKHCNKLGAKLGVPYRCKFLNSEPENLIAEDHYYGKRDGKCYEIISYGSNMSFKEVGLSYCETQEERKERFEKQQITEVEYI